MEEFFPTKNSEKCEEIICNQSNPYSKYRKYASLFESEETNDLSTETKEKEIDHYKFCPNNKESLGFFTWNFLHTMSIYYPAKPTEIDKNKMITFIDGLAHFYPCKICSFDFQRKIKQNPPKVDSGENLSVWFCERHNEVNLKLGKELFDCSYKNLLKRWKTGYEHCKDNYQI